MPQWCNDHVGGFDFCEGPLAWGEGLACLATLGDILCVPDNARPEEAKAQSFGSEGPWADVASGETLVGLGN